jgi:hypothetical protein
MVKNLIVIGCGNIGSRHIQALAKLPFDTKVEVVDPDHDSQKTAQSRLNEINYDKQKHEFFWFSSISELKQNNNDLVIIATTATNRISILEQLLLLNDSKFLIEKMVCQSVKEYEKILELMKKFNARGWVNTCLRYFSSWKKIKEQIDISKPLYVSIIASNVSALGTNAIHYLDLFSWFVDDYKIKLDGNFLINELFPNKRGINLVEFAGTLIARNSKNSLISLTFLPNTKIPNTVSIVNGHNHIFINETDQTNFNVSKNQESVFEFEHVSSTTNKIVSDIILKDDCVLTTIENSFYLHREIINIFNHHIKKLTNKQIEHCPIT